jgi:hypothetical protein
MMMRAPTRGSATRPKGRISAAASVPPVSASRTRQPPLLRRTLTTRPTTVTCPDTFIHLGRALPESALFGGSRLNCNTSVTVEQLAGANAQGGGHSGELRIGQGKDLCHTVKAHSVANSGTSSGCSISKGSVACGVYPILEYHIFRNSLLG